MRKVILIAALISFVAINLTAQNKKSTLLMDMSQFDKAYIPALFYTNQNNAEYSARSIDGLLRVWNGFMSRHKNPELPDSLWGRDIGQIDKLIGNAAEIVYKQQSLDSAHENLERVRYVLLEMRERNDIEYYMDDLTRFHAEMEKIVEIAGDKENNELEQSELSRINSHLDNALEIWKKVMLKIFNQKLFSFSDKQYKRLNELIEFEEKALGELKTALDSDEKDAVIRSKAMAVKPDFVKLFLLFGGFSEDFLKNRVY